MAVARRVCVVVSVWCVGKLGAAISVFGCVPRGSTVGSTWFRLRSSALAGDILI